MAALEKTSPKLNNVSTWQSVESVVPGRERKVEISIGDFNSVDVLEDSHELGLNAFDGSIDISRLEVKFGLIVRIV